MNCSERLTTDLTGAVPTSQFTPGQRMFRATLGEGRWQHDLPLGLHPGAADRITIHPDNTADVVALEAYPEGWRDLGGPTPRDVAIGRP